MSTNRRNQLIITCFMTIMIIVPGYAAIELPTDYQNKMVYESDSIVVVEVTKIENVLKNGKKIGHRHKAIATVKQSIKGNLKDEITILGGFEMKCMRSQLKKGKYLLFLTKNKAGELVNWYGSVSIHKIENDKINWRGKQISLADSKSEIKKILKNKSEKKDKDGSKESKKK